MTTLTLRGIICGNGYHWWAYGESWFLVDDARVTGPSEGFRGEAHRGLQHCFGSTPPPSLHLPPLLRSSEMNPRDLPQTRLAL